MTAIVDGRRMAETGTGSVRSTTSAVPGRQSPLSPPQWEAALTAARILREGNPHNADDRASFRAARDKLASLLPDDADTRPIVTRAVHWDAMNTMMPQDNERIEHGR